MVKVQSTGPRRSGIRDPTQTFATVAFMSTGFGTLGAALIPRATPEPVPQG